MFNERYGTWADELYRTGALYFDNSDDVSMNKKFLICDLFEYFESKSVNYKSISSL